MASGGAERNSSMKTMGPLRGEWHASNGPPASILSVPVKGSSNGMLTDPPHSRRHTPLRRRCAYRTFPLISPDEIVVTVPKISQFVFRVAYKDDLNLSP